MLKEGDEIVRLCNLVNIQELARIRDEKEKLFRLELWKVEYKLAEGF